MNRPSFNYFAPLAVILATLFFLSGCLPDKEKAAAAQRERLQKQIAATSELLSSGQGDRAIEQLTRLEKDNPNNLAVVEALGFAYSQRPDPLMAALYFEHAFELAPTQAELALFAAQANVEVGQYENAADAYRAYLKLTPGDADSWRKLGAIEARLQRNQPALSAYLEALRLSGNRPTSAEQLTVARLYHNLGNQPQAARWYESLLANKTASPEERADALLGQFDLALRQKSWDQAIALMNELDTLAPGTLASGPYSQAHAELTRWDNARKEQAAAALGAKSPKAAQEAQAAQETKTTDQSAADAPQAEGADKAVSVEKTADTLATGVTATGTAATATATADSTATDSAATTATATTTAATQQPVEATATAAATSAVTAAAPSASTATETADTTATAASNTTATTADAAATATAAQTTATAPAAEQSTVAAAAPTAETATETPTAETAVRSSGTIGSSSKLPAEDEIPSAVATTTANDTAATTATDILTTEADAAQPQTADAARATTVEGELAQQPKQPAPPAIEDAATELSIAQDASAAELAARGTELFEAGNFEQAAELLERSVKLNPGNAAVLDMLSRASYRIGKFPQAERYATLATYAEPENLAYRLEYLRAYQRNNAPTLLLQQLINAKADFPDSPPVTLALARGYEYIANKKSLAAGIYREYLEQDPKSPLAAEIRQKLLEWEL